MIMTGIIRHLNRMMSLRPLHDAASPANRLRKCFTASLQPASALWGTPTKDGTAVVGSPALPDRVLAGSGSCHDQEWD